MPRLLRASVARRCAVSYAAMATVAAGLLSVATTAQAAHYNLLILPGLPGGDGSSAAYAVSNARQVAGVAYTAVGDHAFLWSAATGMEDLGALPDPIEGVSVGYGINDRREVVGSSGPDSRAFLWSASTGMRTLGPVQPNGPNALVAWGTNDRGDVVGEMGNANAMFGEGNHAFLWSETGGVRDLGDLPGGSDHSTAFAINASRQVVGSTSVPNGVHPFLWSVSTGMQDLGTLPDSPQVAIGQANDINNAGQVVGTVTAGASEEPHGFIWSASTGMKDLGVLSDGGYSYAYGINAAGEVVGQSGGPGTRYAVLWDIQTGIVDLNTVVDHTDFVMTEARAINDGCVIVGIGYEPSSSQPRAFVLWPKSLADCPCANPP